MHITTMTQKGQVTIPKKIRDELGLKAGDKVVSEKFGKEIRVKAVPDFFSFRGSIKSKRKFSQKLIHEEEKAARDYVVKQYLKKVERMKKYE